MVLFIITRLTRLHCCGFCRVLSVSTSDSRCEFLLITASDYARITQVERQLMRVRGASAGIMHTPLLADFTMFWSFHCWDLVLSCHSVLMLTEVTVVTLKFKDPCTVLHTQMHTSTCVQIHAHTNAHKHMQADTNARKHMHANTGKHKHTQARVYKHRHTQTHTSTCVQTHARTHKIAHGCLECHNLG